MVWSLSYFNSSLCSSIHTIFYTPHYEFAYVIYHQRTALLTLLPFVILYVGHHWLSFLLMHLYTWILLFAQNPLPVRLFINSGLNSLVIFPGIFTSPKSLFQFIPHDAYLTSYGNFPTVVLHFYTHQLFRDFFFPCRFLCSGKLPRVQLVVYYRKSHHCQMRENLPNV